jgi:phosphatidylserine/phosphatidylglycerophosphate/cardiolipin synthase-like enzyme
MRAAATAIKGKERRMKLIIEPDDGAAPLHAALKGARKTLEIAIFRFDRSDIETLLKAVVADGVKVTALVADVNRGGEKNLRELEKRFLENGITVARTSADLSRYHDKYFIIDRRVLVVLSFNFTHLDIEHSRGFGIVTKNKVLIQEAVQLFEADCARRAYVAGTDNFVVSPANSRKVLRSFLKRAKKQLFIYDPQISDKEMIRVLQERIEAGVDVRIIGKISGPSGVTAQKLTRMRLHTRTIIRDGRQAFVGSQSLRPAELDSRRELGLMVRDAKIVKKLLATFESDWSTTNAAMQDVQEEEMPEATKNETEKALAVLVHELQPLSTTVKRAVKKVAAQTGGEALPSKMVKSTVKKVVKKAVKQAVRAVVRDARKAHG